MAKGGSKASMALSMANVGPLSRVASSAGYKAMPAGLGQSPPAFIASSLFPP
jgi:hypothetical protein